MQISGIGGGNTEGLRPISMPKSTEINPEVDNLQKQIEAKRKQLSDLQNDDRMSPEQKQKKREEIQQEISELEAQKNAAEMAAKQKEREEAQERQAKSSGDTYSRNQDGDISRISARGMQAMISASKSMEMAELKENIQNSFEDEASILETEIKLDEGKGVVSERKEKELADINVKTKTLGQENARDLQRANEEIEERFRDKDDNEHVDEEEKSAFTNTGRIEEGGSGNGNF